jgi:hypothetical protein
LPKFFIIIIRVRLNDAILYLQLNSFFYLLQEGLVI